MELTARERSAFEKRMATALIECPCGTPKRKTVAGQMVLPAVELGGFSYNRGDFHKPWMELTARERSAFEKRMATALIECPCGTANMKAIVAGQMRPQ
jgi:hypothetical protein